MRNRRSAIAVLAVALFVIPSTGCLDAQDWKVLVKGPDKVKVGWHEVDGPSQYYAYNFDLQDLIDWFTSGNPNDPPTDKEWTHNFRTTADTSRITLSINLTMTSPDDQFWDELEKQANGTGAEDYIHMLRTLERYLKVNLTGPDGLDVGDEFTDSTIGDVQHFVIDPAPGQWTLKIVSRGFGGTFTIPGIGEAEYHDEFTIKTSLREAYYK